MTRLTVAGTYEDILLADQGDESRKTSRSGSTAALVHAAASQQIGRLDSLAFQSSTCRMARRLGWRMARTTASGTPTPAAIGSVASTRTAAWSSRSSAAAIRRPASPSATTAAAWFTNQEADTIGHITTDGDFVEFAIPSPPSSPQDIVRGPDGNYWFTEFDADSIGRITPQGVIKRFPTAPALAGARPRIAAQQRNPQGIAVGPDSNLWFTERGLNKIGRMTTSGEVWSSRSPPATANRGASPPGWDGNFYFTENNAGRVARITTEESSPSSARRSPARSRIHHARSRWRNVVHRERRQSPRPHRARRPDHQIRSARRRLGPTGIIGRNDGRLFYGVYDLSQVGYVDLAAANRRLRRPRPGGLPTPRRSTLFVQAIATVTPR